MKKYITILAASVAVLSSCSLSVKDTVPGTAELCINVAGIPSLTETKAGSGEVQTAEDKKVTGVDIVIYDKAGTLEWSRHYTSVDFTKKRVITGLVAGEKTVCVVANKQISAPTTLAAFNALETKLTENGENGYVMVGTAPAVASEDPEQVDVYLKRIAAKFEFKGKIITEWEGDAPEEFDILAIYLANVASVSDFSFSSKGPSVNLRTTETLTDDAAIAAKTVAYKDSWTSGQPFNGGVEFLSYPNSDPNRTAVIIKAKYDDRITYYPLKIDEPIVNNTLYKFGDIVITCEGVEKPWIDFTKVKVDFKITIEDWTLVDLDGEFVF